MPSDFFLAQTGTEIHHTLPDRAKKAWLGCRFSLSGEGLSNLPPALPEGSMVILTDETAISGHDPQRVTAQLQQILARFSCSRVLLDFQRPVTQEAQSMAQAIVQALPCPVGVAEGYAKGLDCPVFLPPPPLNKTVSAYGAPWQGRQIWLEAAPQQAQYRIDADGCRVLPSSGKVTFPHRDAPLFCRYRIDCQEDSAIFTLARTWEDWLLWMENEEVSCVVGLYQEFAQPEAQSTAFAQWESLSDRSSSES